MPESSKLTQTPAGKVPVPYVVLKRADGTIVLRHPDEIKPLPAPAVVVKP